MAKRGESRPWRMRYLWDSGITGVETFRTEEEARTRATKQEALLGPNGERCTATVSHRDQS